MVKINESFRVSWTQARINKYAESVVGVLQEKGIKMVRNKNGPIISWNIRKKGRKNLADVKIIIIFDNCHSQPSADIIVRTSYPCDSWENWFKKIVIEKINDKVVKIYPLINHTLTTSARKTVFRPASGKEVARQICLALERYKLVSDRKTKIDSAVERMNELAKKEVNKLVESLFQ